MKTPTAYLIFIFVCFQISLMAQPEKGKPGSKDSYKIQENYNVLANDNSILEGPYELWYKGIKLVSGNFSNNQKTGLWKFNNLKLPYKDEKGKLVDSLSREIYYQGYYKNDKKNGAWKYFLNQKPLCSIYFKDNLRDSVWKSFYPNGKLQYLVNYTQGLKNGLYEYYAMNGTKLISNEYTNDLLNGHYTLYNIDGEINVNIEYKNGIPYNIFVLKDNFGLPLDAGTLKNGTGTVKYYDKKNHLALLETYKDGLKDGLTEKYYTTNGNISEKGTFSKGKKNNDWIYLKLDGSPEKTITLNEETTIDSIKKENNVDFATIYAEYRPHPQGGDDELQGFFDANIPTKFSFIDDYGKAKSPYSYTITSINYATFGVSATGKIYQFEMNSNLSSEERETIKKAFLSMPPWVPAFNQGFPVEYIYRMPITSSK